jgi:hypothetical protein
MQKNNLLHLVFWVKIAFYLHPYECNGKIIFYRPIQLTWFLFPFLCGIGTKIGTKLLDKTKKENGDYKTRV